MAVNGWIIERTVDLAHPPKTLRNEQPYEITYTGDMANPVWTVHILQDSQPVALGGSVKAYIRRIDGAEVISNGTISGNTVTVELGGSNFGQPGYTWGILRYTDSTTNATVTLDALTMMVQTDPDGTSVLDPDDMLPTLQELLAELDDMRDATAAAEAAADAVPDMVAPVFSTSTEYSAGSYIYYDGALYRFTVDHAAGAWNSAHAVAVTVGGEIADLKSAIGNDEITSLLLADPIPDTVQAIAFGTSGNVQTITHSRDGATVRTDAFTFSDGSITEVRTLATGESLTIVTNTDTLVTTTTYAEETA